MFPYSLILYCLIAFGTKLSAYPVALSYAADSCSPSQRSKAFAEVSGAMFLGTTTGPLIAYFLSCTTSLLVGASIGLGIWIWTAFIPESHKLNPASGERQPLVAA